VTAPAATAASRPADAPAAHTPQGSLAKLALGAVGVVFGDIGTSPLYAFRETFAGHHPLPLDQLHIFGVLSVVFWSMMLIVTVKYITVLLRADNRGEGGSLALLALISRKGRGGWWVVMLGIIACALFYGDSMITPAISVLSAVEGLTVVEARLEPLVVPLACVILVGLFFLQRRGTAKVGALFAPIVCVYFVTLAALGLANIHHDWSILQALSPHWAARFFVEDTLRAFLALGSVVLAVTGAEALYADMGHFGRKPIRAAWLYFVFPALMLNYLGQGALLLANPAAIENPFYLLAPEALRLPLVFLAVMATIIASQAVISGAFSVTQAAIQLGFIPRMRVLHTSATAFGQIYIPLVNWLLMALVITLVVTFGSSSNLAAAYGIAVTGAMLIDTLLLSVVVFALWRWNRWLAFGAIGLFLVIDVAYFAANLTKVPDGGWFPLLVGVLLFTALTTWRKGRQLMAQRLRESAMPIEVFIRSARGSAARVPGTAVFLTSTPEGVPHALLHNLKHNKVLHERIIILTVRIEEVPWVEDASRFELTPLGDDFYRLILRYGFMQEPDVPAALKLVEGCGAQFRMMDTSFFLARQTLIASARPGMAIWREKLFAWMLNNAETAMSFFKLPTNRVVELGSQVEI
jgi:KUP system potassium uptake protein